MARDFDFRPDSDRSVELDKLLLTQRQRFSLLRWVLYGVMCLAGLLLQDAVLCRIDFYGGCTDLVPCIIFVIAAVQGAEQGSIFSLLAAVFYACTGSAPGLHVIPLITVIAVLVAIFRQACLRRGFFSIFLSALLAMFVYEMAIFGAGIFLHRMIAGQLTGMLVTVGLTMVALPALYPLAHAIGRIGGEAWKE